MSVANVGAPRAQNEMEEALRLQIEGISTRTNNNSTQLDTIERAIDAETANASKMTGFLVKMLGLAAAAFTWTVKEKKKETITSQPKQNELSPSLPNQVAKPSVQAPQQSALPPMQIPQTTVPAIYSSADGASVQTIREGSYVRTVHRGPGTESSSISADVGDWLKTAVKGLEIGTDLAKELEKLRNPSPSPSIPHNPTPPMRSVAHPPSDMQVLRMAPAEIPSLSLLSNEQRDQLLLHLLTERNRQAQIAPQPLVERKRLT